METEITPQRHIPERVESTLGLAEDILAGRFRDEIEEGVEELLASGVLLDHNDPELSDYAKRYVENWMCGVLELDVLTASQEDFREEYISSDGKTSVSIFAKPLSTEENPWLISKWQTEGEKPSYIFWPEEFYNEQLQSGYSIKNSAPTDTTLQ